MRKLLNVFLALVMTFMCTVAVVQPAYAEELPGVTVPVTISLSGTLPDPKEDYTIVLKADDESYPMPEGVVEGAYTMTITDANTQDLPTITYDHVGIYTYTLYQVAGENEKCTYDDTVYSLKVTISNNEDYTGLEATAVLYPHADGDKLPGAEFKNKYKVEPPVNPPKTGDESTPLLYSVLILVSMGIIVTLFLTRKSKDIEK